MPEAQRLKELLAEAGIAGVLVDADLQEAPGSDVWGLVAPIQVAVDEPYAEAARWIAMGFDSLVAAQAARGAQQRAAAEAEARRKEAEREERAAFEPAGPASWPRCPGCQTPRLSRCPACQTRASEFSPAEMPAGTEAAEPLVLCPECDEPFVPEYARRCHECGHEFPDGFDPSGGPPPDTFNWRVLVTIVALVAVVAVVIAYFAYLLS
jgi:hypothetical protein